MSQPIELAKVQGLVLSGYGHLDYGAYLFFQFTQVSAARAWLYSIIPQISTAAPWPKDAKGNAIKPDVACTLGLSYPGLAALGLPEDSLASFPEDFRDGAASPRRQRILGDDGSSAPEHWVVGGGDAPERLHGMLTILAASAAQRDALIAEHKGRMTDHQMQVLWVDEAAKLPDSREHFGFFDGISQPRFEASARQSHVSEPSIAVGEFLLGYRNEYGQTPLSPTLNGEDLGRNGTYMVYRRLYQDVAAFWRFMAESVVTDIEGDEGSPAHAQAQVRLASKLMGRWPSGVPLTLSPDHDDPDFDRSRLNTFLFHERDPHGYACPLGSHVRRCNPRDSQPPDHAESLRQANRHLLIRRGLPYGAPLFPLDALPPESPADDGQDRGLIFICLNASISRQFEFVQQMWVNNTKFHGLYADKDPIIGNMDGRTHAMTIERDPVRRRLTGLPRFVTVKGSGYFFVPSLSALNRIAALT